MATDSKDRLEDLRRRLDCLPSVGERMTSLPAVLAGTILLATGDVAAATYAPMMPLQAGGWCNFPGGNTALPAAMTFARGTLFVIGISKATASGSDSGGGDYGASSKRKALVVGLLVAALGVLLPQVCSYVLQLFGSSAADIGLGCAI